MTKHYLQLQFSNGQFYEYSKSEQQGFVKHESSKGNISFRKYYKKVSGVLESVDKYDNKDIDWKAEEVVLSIKNGDDVYKLQLPLLDQKGQISTFVESLITYLPNLKKGDNIEFSAYNFTPKDSQYKKVGVSVKVDGKKLERALTNTYKKGDEIVEGDIPMVVWEEKRGKRKPTAVSVEAKEDYLYDQLEQQLKRLSWNGDGQTTEKQEQKPAPEKKKEEPKKTEKKKAIPISEDDIDSSELPF